MSGKIIAVCGSSGAGKSTVCTNLAMALSKDNIVVVYGTRTDYPSIQSFFNTLIPDEKSIKKLYENISLDIPIDIKDYLVQYEDSNIFILSAPDDLRVLTLADEHLTPSERQCKNVLISLRNICDFLIIDCDTNISNPMSAWALNSAEYVINVIKPTQQGLRAFNAYHDYYKEIWRGKVINVANADKNYIGLKQFQDLTNGKIKFDVSLPYDEQAELAENEGVPMIENYRKSSFFGGNYKTEILSLVDMIKSDE